LTLAVNLEANRSLLSPYLECLGVDRLCLYDSFTSFFDLYFVCLLVSACKSGCISLCLDWFGLWSLGACGYLGGCYVCLH